MSQSPFDDAAGEEHAAGVHSPAARAGREAFDASRAGGSVPPRSDAEALTPADYTLAPPPPASEPIGQPPAGLRTSDFLRARIKLAEDSLRKLHAATPGATHATTAAASASPAALAPHAASHMPSSAPQPVPPAHAYNQSPAKAPARSHVSAESHARHASSASEGTDGNPFSSDEEAAQEEAELWREVEDARRRRREAEDDLAASEAQEMTHQQQQRQHSQLHQSSRWSAPVPPAPSPSGEIALIMRVSMDHGVVDLVVPRNADPVDLALEFCREQGLPDEKVDSLAASIESHLDMIMATEQEQRPSASPVAATPRMPMDSQDEEAEAEGSEYGSTSGQLSQRESSYSPRSGNQHGNHRVAHRTPQTQARGRSITPADTQRRRERSRSSSAQRPSRPPRLDMSRVAPNVNRHSISLLQRSARNSQAQLSPVTAEPLPVRSPETEYADDFEPASAADDADEARSVAPAPSREPSLPYLGSYASAVAFMPAHERLHAESAVRRAHLEKLRAAQEAEVAALQKVKMVLKKSRALAAVRMHDSRPVGTRLHQDGVKQLAERERIHQSTPASWELLERAANPADELTFQPLISPMAQAIKRDGDYNFQRILDYDGKRAQRKAERRARQREERMQAALDSPFAFVPRINEVSLELAARRAQKEEAARREIMERMQRFKDMQRGGSGGEEESKQMHATEEKTETPLTQQRAVVPYEPPALVYAIYDDLCRRGVLQAQGQSPTSIPPRPANGFWQVLPSGVARWNESSDPSSGIASGPAPSVSLLSARRYQRAKDVFAVLDSDRDGVIAAEAMESVEKLHPVDQQFVAAMLRRIHHEQLRHRATEYAAAHGLPSVEAAEAALQAEQAAAGTGQPPPVFTLPFSDFLHLFLHELHLLAAAGVHPSYDLLQEPLPQQPPKGARAGSRRGSASATPSTLHDSTHVSRSRSRSVSRPSSRSGSRSASRSHSRSASQSRAAPSAVSVADVVSHSTLHHLQHLASMPLTTASLTPPHTRMRPSQQRVQQVDSFRTPSIHPHSRAMAPASTDEHMRAAYEYQLAALEQQRHDEWLQHQQWLHATKAQYERDMRVRQQLQQQQQESQGRSQQRSQRPSLSAPVSTRADAGVAADSAANAADPSLQTLSEMRLTGESSGPNSLANSQEMPRAADDSSAAARVEANTASSAAAVSAASGDDTSEPHPSHAHIAALRPLTLSSPTASHHEQQPQQQQDRRQRDARPARLPPSSSQLLAQPRTQIQPAGVPRSARIIFPAQAAREHFPETSPAHRPEVSERSRQLAAQARARSQAEMSAGSLHEALHREAYAKQQQRAYTTHAHQLQQARRYAQANVTPYNR